MLRAHAFLLKMCDYCPTFVFVGNFLFVSSCKKWKGKREIIESRSSEKVPRGRVPNLSGSQETLVQS